MIEALNHIPKISCLKPAGAFYAFPNISACFGSTSDTGPITDSVSFCEHLLKNALVAAVPGAGFGSDDYIRLSYATSTESIRLGLDRIREFVTNLT